jgi:hypothetical protein
MAVLHPPATPVSQFHWTPGNPGTFVSEISSTHGFGRVYDDACDEGLTLVLPCGREIVFVIDKTIRGEGETKGWELIPVDVAKQAHARMVLFND